MYSSNFLVARVADDGVLSPGSSGDSYFGSVGLLVPALCCYVITVAVAMLVVLRYQRSRTREQALVPAWRVVLLGSCLALAVASLWPTRYGSATGFNITPLTSIANSFNSQQAALNTVANLVLGIPIGIAANFSRIRIGFWLSLVGVVFLSGAIEVLQRMFSLGICDIDDVLLVALGFAAGYLSLAKVRSSAGSRS